MDLHVDPLLPVLVAAAFAVVAVGFLLQRLRLPSVAAYILVGVLLGPSGLAVISDTQLLTRLGGFGVVLLLFFVGMEISLQRLISNWKVTVLGTLFQIAISVCCVWLLGLWFEWPFSRSILVGFVISLSSTAVVLKILQEWKELDSNVGQDAVGILLVQDLAIVPMLMIIGYLGQPLGGLGDLGLQFVGGVAVAGLIAFLIRTPKIHLPFKRLRADHEMQIFVAFAICFGTALITGLTGLSTALGAFLAGIVVSSARETQWFHESLGAFRVVFVAIFFVSVGMLLDVGFLIEEWMAVASLVVVTFLTNTVINALILRGFGRDWKQSLYAAAFLAQIGEFSFVLAAVGFDSQLITDSGYRLVIAIIASSLFLSPVWIAGIKWLTDGMRWKAHQH